MSSHRRYRLRLPGPSAVPERVVRAMSQPVLNHRGPEFRAVLSEATSLLRPLFGTAGDAMFFASSGTGVMEASVANVVASGERALVIANGQWGERYAAIAKAFGADVDRLDVPWGMAPDPSEVAQRARAHRYRAVLVTHNESSTGVTANLEALGAALRDLDTLLIVDAVSGLGGAEIRQDEWSLDIVVAASQKALMCPPGVGIASVSSKAWDVIERDDRAPRFYLDFRKARHGTTQGETPFTPAVTLLTGLREALLMISEETPSAVVARHAHLARGLRKGAEALGLAGFADPTHASPTVTALTVPDEVDGAALVKHLYRVYGTVVAGSRNKLAGRVIRIGTMGHVDEGDVLVDLLHLGAALRDLGADVEPAAGVAEAARVFAASMGDEAPILQEHPEL